MPNIKCTCRPSKLLTVQKHLGKKAGTDKAQFCRNRKRTDISASAQFKVKLEQFSNSSHGLSLCTTVHLLKHSLSSFNMPHERCSLIDYYESKMNNVEEKCVHKHVFDKI